MKTEDELDADIAKLFDEVTTTKVEMVNGKPRISDQATLDQMEREEAARRMEKACGMFLTAERRFQKLCDHPDRSDRSQSECRVVGKFGASLRARESRLAAVRRPAADHGGQQALRQIPKALARRQQVES